MSHHVGTEPRFSTRAMRVGTFNHEAISPTLAIFSYYITSYTKLLPLSLTWHHLLPRWRPPFFNSHTLKCLWLRHQEKNQAILTIQLCWHHSSENAIVLAEKQPLHVLLNPVFSSPWELGYQNDFLFSITGTMSSYRTIQFLSEIKPICS